MQNNNLILNEGKQKNFIDIEKYNCIKFYI